MMQQNDAVLALDEVLLINDERNQDDQIILQQILANDVVPMGIFNNDEEVPIVLGQAVPNPINPHEAPQSNGDRRAFGQHELDVDLALLNEQPMDIDIAVAHPADEGGLDADAIDVMMGIEETIRFSPTVQVVNVANDHQIHQDALAVQVEDNPDLDVPEVMIFLALLPEPIFINDLLDRCSNNEIKLMTKNVEENIIVPIATQTFPAVDIAPENNSATEDRQEDISLEVPRIDESNSTIDVSAESPGEVHDGNHAIAEDEPIENPIINVVGAVALPMESTGDHRPKPVETLQIAPREDETITDQRLSV